MIIVRDMKDMEKNVIRKKHKNSKKLVFALFVFIVLFGMINCVFWAQTEAENQKVTYGDLNDDEKVDLRDAQLALKAALHIIKLDGRQYEAADVDGTQRIDLSDARYILRYALKIVDAFPIQSTNSPSNVPVFPSVTATPDVTATPSATEIPDIIVPPEITVSPDATPEPGEAEYTMMIRIGNHSLIASLVHNSSTEALLEMLKKGPVTVEMSDYANMEKVGSLPESLPRNDEHINTEAGDLILYQGNSFVIYYDTNSWNLTRLGKIENVTQEELKEILGDGNIIAVLSI